MMRFVCVCACERVVYCSSLPLLSLPLISVFISLPLFLVFLLNAINKLVSDLSYIYPCPDMWLALYFWRRSGDLTKYLITAVIIFCFFSFTDPLEKMKDINWSCFSPFSQVGVSTKSRRLRIPSLQNKTINKILLLLGLGKWEYLI